MKGDFRIDEIFWKKMLKKYNPQNVLQLSDKFWSIFT